MTKEEKQLLFKDLCARLPYGVKVNYKGLIRPLFSVSPTQHYQITLDNAIDGRHNGLELVSLDTDAVELKPYLRPMSSMTEEEFKEYLSMLGDIDKFELMIQQMQKLITRVVDWLDRKMFDHRGLIPMGLALVATEGMYNIK